MPVTDSTKINANAYVSAFSSKGSLRACSGEQYRARSWEIIALSSHADSAITEEIPMSATRTRASSPNIITEGRRS